MAPVLSIERKVSTPVPPSSGGGFGLSRLLLLTLLFAAMPALIVCLADLGQFRLKVPLSGPYLHECKNCYLADVPEPQLNQFLKVVNFGVSPHSRTELAVNGTTLIETADQSLIRLKGQGHFAQFGKKIWFALPDNGDPNERNFSKYKLESRLIVQAKPWLSALVYAFFAFIASAYLIVAWRDPAREPFLVKAILLALKPAVDPALRLVKKASVQIRHCLGENKLLIFGILSLILARIILLPVCINLEDSLVMMSWPWHTIGHYPPLYPGFMLALKTVFGLGKNFFAASMAVQYSFLAVSMFYFATAFAKQNWRLLALAALGLNFYLLVIVGGYFSESIALPALLLILGSTLRVVQSGRLRLSDSLIYVFAVVICMLTRHAYLVFAATLPAFALFNLVFEAVLRWFDSNSTKWVALKVPAQVLVLSTVLLAVGFVGGKLATSGLCAVLHRDYFIPEGHQGVQVIAHSWKQIKEEDRKKTAEHFSSFSDDPIVHAVFHVMSQAPNHNSVFIDWCDEYDKIKNYIRTSGKPALVARMNDNLQFERALTEATRIFWFHPDSYFLNHLWHSFIEYTQLNKLKIANEVYRFQKFEFSKEPQVLNQMNPIPHMFMSRNLLYQGGISRQYFDKFPEVQNLLNYVLTEKHLERLKAAVNSQSLFLLDFVNPLNALIGFGSLVILLTFAERLSRRAAAFFLALGSTVCLYWIAQCFGVSEVYARYLAPVTLMLSSGILVALYAFARSGRLSSD